MFASQRTDIRLLSPSHLTVRAIIEQRQNDKALIDGRVIGVVAYIVTDIGQIMRNNPHDYLAAAAGMFDVPVCSEGGIVRPPAASSRWCQPPDLPFVGRKSWTISHFNSLKRCAIFLNKWPRRCKDHDAGVYQATGKKIVYLDAPAVMRGRGSNSRWFSAEGPLRLLPRVIRHPR